jgi:hypothetical protein
MAGKYCSSSAREVILYDARSTGEARRDGPEASAAESEDGGRPPSGVRQASTLLSLS